MWLILKNFLFTDHKKVKTNSPQQIYSKSIRGTVAREEITKRETVSDLSVLIFPSVKFL